ncbi:retrotransposon protein [Cucumis melo var. makuwa]|uniref:Retrotransposon protein n=1 Tax=Cucumis melo var. makuwa TaxID=1194695 RepID=A0A5D3D8J3_CUCMM|nr:retrotransposon protein [Cucumis melo var. makuwa]
MDRRTFVILCHLLQTVSGLSSTEVVDVEEMVAMFLHVLAHDVKNRVIQREFIRSGETVSGHFNLVLLAVVRLYEELIKRPVPNCLGTLDGTYIKVNISATDRPTFRMRKGKLPQMYWACATRKEISFMSLPVRKDSWQTRGFYVMPFHEKMDYKILLSVRAGYPNAEGILVPYGGQRYHLQECRGAGNTPTNAKEYFNMKHSSAMNVIERAFGVLKGHWAIIRGKSYNPLQV